MIDNTIIFRDCDNIISNVHLDKMINKKVLITGASGLIGTYLASSIFRFNLANKGKINMTLVCRKNLPDHMLDIASSPYCEILAGDLTDPSFLDNLGKYDYIIHAACYGQPGMFMQDKAKTIIINTFTTGKLLENVNPGGGFLFISTSEIYSGSNKIPYDELCEGVSMPNHPRACYIEGKRSGEAMCYSFLDKNIDVKIARVSLAYGPGTKKEDKRVLYNFIQKALINKKIEMLDQGASMRMYCYVSDTVEMLFNILVNGKEILYNVGGVSEVSIKELAGIIGKIMEVEVVIPSVDSLEMSAAPKTVAINSSKVRNEFGKNTFVDINEGLRRTILWYKQYFM